MEENDTFVDQFNHQIDSDDHNKKIFDALVHEELKFSFPQSSSHQRTKQAPRESHTNDTESQVKSKEELLREVVLSLAMEQRAVAQFIQAEAKHVQVFLQHEQDNSSNSAHHAQFQSDLVRIIEGLVEKQKMSMRLLDISRVLLREE